MKKVFINLQIQFTGLGMFIFRESIFLFLISFCYPIFFNFALIIPAKENLNTDRWINLTKAAQN